MLNLLISNAISFSLLMYLGNNLLESREMSNYKRILVYLVFVTSLTLLNGEIVNLYNTLNLTIGYLLYLLCIPISKSNFKYPLVKGFYAPLSTCGRVDGRSFFYLCLLFCIFYHVKCNNSMNY